METEEIALALSVISLIIHYFSLKHGFERRKEERTAFNQQQINLAELEGLERLRGLESEYSDRKTFEIWKQLLEIVKKYDLKDKQQGDDIFRIWDKMNQAFWKDKYQQDLVKHYWNMFNSEDYNP